VTKNEKILISLFFGTGILIFLLCSHIIVFPCVFKQIFSISCPGCGLTRSFCCLLSGDFVGSFSYHILGIPIFLIGILFFCLIVYDLFFQKHVFENVIVWMLGHWVWLLVIVFISWVVNLFRGI